MVHPTPFHPTLPNLMQSSASTAAPMVAKLSTQPYQAFTPLFLVLYILHSTRSVPEEKVGRTPGCEPLQYGQEFQVLLLYTKQTP